MYAIIRAGGHQEKVTVGETITVDHLKQDPESQVSFTPLLVSVDEGTVVSDRKELAANAAVLGRVVRHVRGDKIDVFQYRQKTGFRKHTGHRSLLTMVEIAEIRFGDRRETLEDAQAAAAKAAEEKAAASTALVEAKEKAKAERKEKEAAARSARKPAAKAAAKPAARKPAARKAASKAKEPAAAEPAAEVAAEPVAEVAPQAAEPQAAEPQADTGSESSES